MPDIRVIYWNVQNFGLAQSGCRGNYVPLCNFIAQVVRNVDADILCLMEMTQAGNAGPIQQLQSSLMNAYTVGGIYTCDWLCDVIAGAVVYDDFAGLPYNPNLVDFTFLGRYEGYAVLWKQNIAKFTVNGADPIDRAISTPPNFMPAAGIVANTQSRGVSIRAAGGALQLVPGDISPGGGQQYLMPAGTTVGPNGITRPLSPPVVPPPGPGGSPPTPANINLQAGDTVSAGTQFSAPGLYLNNAIAGINPIVVPAGYRLTADLTLPANLDVLAPDRALSLVMNTRQVGGGATYDPLVIGNNHWESAVFPGTDGASFWNGCRRAAFFTIKTTTIPAGAAQQLLPITIYHAPVAAPAQAMLRCSLSRSLYEAHTGGGAHVHNARALVGGDFNQQLAPLTHAYAAYTDTYAADGADFRDGATPNIRVNSPAPFPVPPFPPFHGPATPAMTPANRTTVQLTSPVIAGTRVLSANTDYYRQLAIDNIFFRGITGLQAPMSLFRATVVGRHQFLANVYDLVLAVTRNVPPGAGAAPPGLPADNFFFPTALIQDFLNVPALQWLGMGLMPPGLNQSINRHTLFNDVAFGAFPDPNLPNPTSLPGPYVPGGWPALIPPERRAAEFIKLFISDHLPILFRMNI
jgi:hypothetical protein